MWVLYYKIGLEIVIYRTLTKNIAKDCILASITFMRWTIPCILVAFAHPHHFVYKIAWLQCFTDQKNILNTIKIPSTLDFPLCQILNLATLCNNLPCHTNKTTKSTKTKLNRDSSSLIPLNKFSNDQLPLLVLLK